MQLHIRSALRALGTAPAEAYGASDLRDCAGPPAGWSPRLARAIAAAIAARIEIVMTAHRSAYEAAAAYEELSRLSNAELGRRGLPRAGIAWQIFKILTQPK
jgi:hypothetical protein